MRKRAAFQGINPDFVTAFTTMRHLARSTLAIGLVASILLTQIVSCQQQQQSQQPAAPAAPATPTGPFYPAQSISVPSSLSNQQAPVRSNGTVAPESKQQAVQEWPLVNVDGQANKSVVDVHVPIFFDMVNQADKEQGKSKLNLSVLQGLVTVNKDKARDQNGQMTGPVKVTVLGIPVYTSKGTPPSQTTSAAPLSRAELENAIETKRASLAASAEEASASLTSKVQEINRRVLGSLSDIFERLSTTLRRASSAPSPMPTAASSTEQARIELNRAGNALPAGGPQSPAQTPVDVGRLVNDNKGRTM
jgi:hypothetical protein